MGFLPGIGAPEMMIVGVIALLLFGKNLPNVARNLGKSFAEFKKGISGFQDEIRNASRDAERNMTYTPPTPRATDENRPKATVDATASEDDFAAPRFDIS
jgi:sec-independent protein translocase protein TatA